MDFTFDCNDLYKWVDNHQLTRPKKNIHRDFADAVPMAELLKKHYPKLVELHNYSPQNSHAQKLVNWQTLNKKVLNKLKINLTPESMELLSKGSFGALEKLLNEVRIRIEQRESGDTTPTSNKVFYVDGLSNYSGNVIPIKVKNGSKIVDQKMMPSEVYDKMEKDLCLQVEAIRSLKEKVDHLEKMNQVKDERIKDLTRQLQTILNESNDSDDKRSRFFNRLF